MPRRNQTPDQFVKDFADFLNLDVADRRWLNALRALYVADEVLYNRMKPGDALMKDWHAMQRLKKHCERHVLYAIRKRLKRRTPAVDAVRADKEHRQPSLAKEAA